MSWTLAAVALGFWCCGFTWAWVYWARVLRAERARIDSYLESARRADAAHVERMKRRIDDVAADSRRRFEGLRRKVDKWMAGARACASEEDAN